MIYVARGSSGKVHILNPATDRPLCGSSCGRGMAIWPQAEMSEEDRRRLCRRCDEIEKQHRKKQEWRLRR